MKFFLRLIFLVVTIAGISITVFAIFKGYNKSVLSLIHFLNEEKHSRQIFDLLTYKKYIYFLFLLIGVNFICLIAYIKFNVLSKLVFNYFNKIILAFRFIFLEIIHSEAKYILIIPALSALYLTITIPITYDEAATYLNYTSKGFISSITYYPAPNNHILNSVLTNLTYYIPFINPTIAVRIPALLSYILSWAIAYVFIKNTISKSFSLLVTAIGSLLFISIYYSYMARGYSMVCLFFIICLYAATNIINDKNIKLNWLWFTTSSVLGFYAMPSFLYPFLTLNGLIFFYKFKTIFPQIKYNIYTAVSVCLLYTPIIIFNGLDSLINNKYVERKPRIEVLKNLPSFFNATITHFTQIHPSIIVTCLFISMLYVIITNNKKILILFSILLISPFILLTLHSVIPYPRTLVYFNLILCIIIFYPLNSLLKKINTTLLIFVLIIPQLILVFQFNKRIKVFDSLSFICVKHSDQILGNKRYFCDEEFFSVLLLYELETKGKNYSLSYNNLKPVNADTLQNFDFAIIGTSVNKTIEKKAILINEYYQIYKY